MKNLHKIVGISEVAQAIIWYIKQNDYIASNRPKICLHPRYGAMFWSEYYGGWDHWGEQSLNRGIHLEWVNKGKPIVDPDKYELVELKPFQKIA